MLCFPVSAQVVLSGGEVWLHAGCGGGRQHDPLGWRWRRAARMVSGGRETNVEGDPVGRARWANHSVGAGELVTRAQAVQRSHRPAHHHWGSGPKRVTPSRAPAAEHPPPRLLRRPV